MRDGTEGRLSSEDAAGIRKHRRERPDAGRGRRVGCRSREMKKRPEMAMDLRVNPALELLAKPRAGLRGEAIKGAGGAKRGLEERASGRHASEDLAVPGNAEAAI